MNRRRPRPLRILAELDRSTEPTQEAILEEIRRALLTGIVPPGSILPLGEIAHAFGVSPIPIREAIKTLQGEGLVQHEPRGDYTVATFTKAEIVELYAVRSALELAALPVATREATPEDHRLAHDLHAELDLALRTGDLAAWHRGSRRFHEALVAPCGMHHLLHLLETAWNATELVQPMLLLPAASLAELNAEHAVMADSFARGDAEMLAAETSSHLEHVRSALDGLPADHPAFGATGLTTRHTGS